MADLTVMPQPAREHPPLSRAVVVDVLQKLVATPSVNSTLAPEEGTNETEVAKLACGWLQDYGIRAWLEEAAPGRPNVVAEVGTGAGPTLVLCAHLDTVATAGMTIPPFEPRIADDRMYGRGSYDMKGGVAAVLCAAAELANHPDNVRVLVALVADEEYASIGAQDFVRRHQADGCVLTEATEGKLILAHKGFVWLEIVTTGKAAHGSRWDLGVSAIAKMGNIIAALEDFDRTQLRKRTHPLVGPASQHCALIEGGTGLSTYAEQCTLKLERRTLPGETPEQVLEEARSIVRATGEEAEVRVILDRPPLTCAEDALLAQCARAAIQETTGTEPSITGVGYWMDAALFAAAGMQTVDYGPTGAGAHEAVEWVDIDSVLTTAKVLVKTAHNFCSPS